jgi:DNA polymerase-3 subunit gamma/tau
VADTPFVSLYRRFRPARFSDIRGQDHVVRALRSAVQHERVSHAYLFSGPRGTGKTSSARILAKALNCEAPEDGEPCGRCASCIEIAQGNSLNVHELDAASNNGVDAMRDLVAHAGLGTPGRWKVYIVDEVHMLSTAAANALLKTLEEPPGHVVFVLATTDPQKVPPTIRSRTQHLEFRLLGADTLHALLESVNDAAGLDLGEEALEAAVRRGRGSARDALSALDQVVASGSADSARPELAQVVDALATADVAAVLVSLNALLAGGWGPQQLATELADDLRQIFLAALAPELCATTGEARDRGAGLAETMGLPRVVRTMEILGHAVVDMREAPDAQVVLEVALVRAVRPDLDSGVEALADRVSVLERAASGAAAFPRPHAPEPRSPVPTAASEAVDVGHRPSVGAVRRRKDERRKDEDEDKNKVENKVENKDEVKNKDENKVKNKVEDEVENKDGDDEERSALRTDRGRVEGASDTPTGRVADPATRTSAPASETGVAVDRDTLTEAWGDIILGALPARAKARFASGRFVAVDDEGARFALPNAAHRDQCSEQLATVEAAISAHFGTPVRLVLTIDDDAGPPPRAVLSAGPELGTPNEFVEGVDDVDPSELTGDDDAVSAAEARLLQAFPGASEVGA